MRKAIFAAILLTLVVVMVAPVGATPPETIDITSTSLYSFSDFGNPTGTWSSEGLIESEGDLFDILGHFGAGWPPGKGFQTTHLIEVYSDDSGTMTILSQGTGFEWTYDGPYEHFEGSGNWVFLSGTGAYENLRGQGTFDVIGDVDWGAGTMVIGATYSGQAHFDPQE